MRRFCWRERSEKLNWRLLQDLDVKTVVQRGDPTVLEPYALHITFAQLPDTSKKTSTRDAWFLVRILQLAMEYLLFMRTNDSDLLESVNQELRLVDQDRDEQILSLQKWKARARSGDKQVEKLQQVLQNIAKLLQIHGASPSAVVTVETLLTELISDRQAKQKRRALVGKNGNSRDDMSPAVQGARVCGFCGKLFSSAEYLEKHLVRRHRGESIEVKTPVPGKMRRDFADEIVKKSEVKNAVTNATMQKTVEQLKQSLSEHEKKIRSLAQDDEEKVKQRYERLRLETTVLTEMKARQLQIERLNEDLRHQLDGMNAQKQQFEKILGDLKQQIELLTVKMTMIGILNDAVVPLGSANESNEALIAAETEVNALRQTLMNLKLELASTQRKLTKVQALHLSALRKKKELADKLALSRVIPSIGRQEMSSQTGQVCMVNETAQTVEQPSDPPCAAATVMRQDKSFQIEQPCKVHESVQTDEHSSSKELCRPFCKYVGTDPLILVNAGVETQSLDLLLIPPINSEAMFSIVDEEHAAISYSTSPKSISHGLLVADAGDVPEKVEIPEEAPRNEEERGVDYIQQMASQDLLKIVAERAQRAANSVKPHDMTVSKNYSSISLHKCVCSIFQHDEDVAKERVACCLEQLEQVAHPLKSASGIDEQAICGHLVGLPADILSKIVNCENAICAMIEKEWVPMEESQDERCETENRSKSKEL